MALRVMAPDFLSVHKAILLSMGLLLFTYFVVVNVFFDMPVQRSQMKQQVNAVDQQTCMFQDKIDDAKEKKAAIPVTLRPWTPRKDRKYIWLDVAIDEF
ncbi:unnamed protein product [Peronospora destructor]|uniref:Uncharacterized protein n=1 Tax=Peronospora destructor TaxID=86335 RepID=A0AAV0SXC9_9STRA|nr:unnamed protein product [Peronospora destructor]